MNIEARLIEKIGSVGGKLHTARSRNDQVALDVRLYLRDEADVIRAALAALQRALLDQAEAHLDVILPGYTHLQTAQPILYLLWGANHAAHHGRGGLCHGRNSGHSLLSGRRGRNYSCNLLFYGVACGIHVSAKKYGLGKVPPELMPKAREVFIPRQILILLVPIGILVYLLALLLPPQLAAGVALIAVMVVFLLFGGSL